MIGPDFRFKRILLSLLFILPSYSALSQNEKAGQKPSKTEKMPLTFKVPVDVVVVNATVTDKQGKPVLDLTVDDFKLFEDGKPQPIHTFAIESYKTTQSAAATGPKPGAEVRAKEEEAPNFSQPRLFSLVIDDMTAASSEYYYYTTEAMRKFVDQDMGPGDQVAILSGSGRVQHPFTNDRQLILAEIGALHNKLNVAGISKSTCPTLTDLQAQRIATYQNDLSSLEVATQEFVACAHLDQSPTMAEAIVRGAAMMQYQESQFRTRNLLQVLRQHIRSLKHFEAKKNLILFSDGFLSEEIIYELQDVVDQALRAGVVLNTVDVRGLYVAMAQASDSMTDFPLSLLPKKQALFGDDARAQEDPLFQMAHDTGGIFHHNNNDLHAGLKKISDRQTHYYVLSYATPSQKADGRYHKIKLEVSRPGLELSYRKGFYSPKEQLTFERKRKEDILEALRAPGNVNEIPVGFSYNSYQFDDTRYEVELVTRVDIRRMQFVEEESRRRNLISLVVVALDENDRYIDGSQKDVTFNLTPSGYSELMSSGFSSRVSFRVPPGRYKIKTVIRESVQSKMGSLTKAIDIP